jgi:hypothetical protein
VDSDESAPPRYRIFSAAHADTLVLEWLERGTLTVEGAVPLIHFIKDEIAPSQREITFLDQLVRGLMPGIHRYDMIDPVFARAQSKHELHIRLLFKQIQGEIISGALFVCGYKVSAFTTKVAGRAIIESMRKADLLAQEAADMGILQVNITDLPEQVPPLTTEFSAPARHRKRTASPDPRLN